MSAVVESCRGSPLTQLRRPSVAGVDLVRRCTSHGPSGLNVALLPLHHWPPEISSWNSRSDTSLATTKPAMCASAAGRRFEVARSRADHDAELDLPVGLDGCPRGISTSSSGPTTVFGALMNMTGISGGADAGLGGVGGVVHADAEHGAGSRDRGADAQIGGALEFGQLARLERVAHLRSRPPGLQERRSRCPRSGALRSYVASSVTSAGVSAPTGPERAILIVVLLIVPADGSDARRREGTLHVVWNVRTLSAISSIRKTKQQMLRIHPMYILEPRPGTHRARRRGLRCRRAESGGTACDDSQLGFGAAQVGNLSGRPPTRSPRSVDAAWDAGIRYFDTAPHYGLGLSERRLGAALANGRATSTWSPRRSGDCSCPTRRARGGRQRGLRRPGDRTPAVGLQPRTASSARSKRAWSASGWTGSTSSTCTTRTSIGSGADEAIPALDRTA